MKKAPASAGAIFIKSGFALVADEVHRQRIGAAVASEYGADIADNDILDLALEHRSESFGFFKAVGVGDIDGLRLGVDGVFLKEVKKRFGSGVLAPRLSCDVDLSVIADVKNGSDSEHRSRDSCSG